MYFSLVKASLRVGAILIRVTRAIARGSIANPKRWGWRSPYLFAGFLLACSGASSVWAQPVIVTPPPGTYSYSFEYNLGLPFPFDVFRDLQEAGNIVHDTRSVKYDDVAHCASPILMGCQPLEGIYIETRVTADATRRGVVPVAQVNGYLEVTQNPQAEFWVNAAGDSLIANVISQAQVEFTAEVRMIAQPPLNFFTQDNGDIRVTWDAKAETRLTGEGQSLTDPGKFILGHLIAPVRFSESATSAAFLTDSSGRFSNVIGAFSKADWTNPSPPLEIENVDLIARPNELFRMRAFATGSLGVNNGQETNSTYYAFADPVLRIDPEWEYAEYFEVVVSPNFRSGELVKDIRPGMANGLAEPKMAVGNQLFFTASDAATGRELWVTDGTEGGTELVKNISVDQFGTSFRDPNKTVRYYGC